jgi:hypothetical protein
MFSKYVFSGFLFIIYYLLFHKIDSFIDNTGTYIVKENTPNQTRKIANMSTSTDINGLPASYVLAKNPSDPSGMSYMVAKVLDIPEFSGVSDATHSYANPARMSPSYMSYNFSETPLHLCNPASIVTQHRCSNIDLPRRVVDISKKAYSEEELQWYADPESTIPPAMRLVMICMLRCYLCGEFQKSEDDIHYESAGEHTYGYRYCTECRPYFLKSLYKTITPIIKFRRDYEAWIESRGSVSKPFIWVARTRRDESGKRIVKGNAPYRYTKWCIINWVARKHDFPRVLPEDNDVVVNEEEYSLVCEQVEGENMLDLENARITKLVPLRDIYIVNYAMLVDQTNDEYDPNNDDPLNKYSEREQREMFNAACAS